MQQMNNEPTQVATAAATKRKKSTQQNSASNRQMLSAGNTGVNTGTSGPSNGVNI
jgi:hypothetical protein